MTSKVAIRGSILLVHNVKILLKPFLSAARNLRARDGTIALSRKEPGWAAGGITTAKRMPLAAMLLGLFSIAGPASASSTLASLLASGSLPASDTVGATASEFGVSSSGAATYSTPIMVPIGTTGVQPKITIDYNSGGGKGPLGYGGSIGGLSIISRCGSDLFHDGKIQPINFSATDKFCLNGERLNPINGGTYGAAGTEYRTAMDEFSRIISYGSVGSGPAYFKVWKKSGEILEYGNDSTSNSFIAAKISRRQGLGL